MDSDQKAEEFHFPIPFLYKDLSQLPATRITLDAPEKLPQEGLLEREVMKDADFWWPFLEPLWSPKNEFTWIIAYLIASEQESVFTAPTILAAFYLGGASLKNPKVILPTFDSTRSSPYKVKGGGMWVTLDIIKIERDSSEILNTPEEKLFRRAQSWEKLLCRYASAAHKDAMGAAQHIIAGNNLENTTKSDLDQEKLCRICYHNHTMHRPIWEPRRPGMADENKIRKARTRFERVITLALEPGEQRPEDVNMSMEFLTDLLTIRANLKDYRKKTAQFNRSLPNLEAACKDAFDQSARHMSLVQISSIIGLRKNSMNRGILGDYLNNRELDGMGL